MKTFRLFAASLFIAAIFAVSAFAQTAGKIGLINTAAFDDDKAGITKFITGRKSLDTEFKKDFDDLNSIANRIQTLEKELAALEQQIKAAANNTGVPVKTDALQASYNTKYDEYTKLGREFKFKQDDTKARYERREQVVLGPIMLDIGNAMGEYQKQKAYTILLDATKLYNAGVLLAWDSTTDVTTDFIKFYNARPATAVNTTTK